MERTATCLCCEREGVGHTIDVDEIFEGERVVYSMTRPPEGWFALPLIDTDPDSEASLVLYFVCPECAVDKEAQR